MCSSMEKLTHNLGRYKCECTQILGGCHLVCVVTNITYSLVGAPECVALSDKSPSLASMIILATGNKTNLSMLRSQICQL